MFAYNNNYIIDDYNTDNYNTDNYLNYDFINKYNRISCFDKNNLSNNLTHLLIKINEPIDCLPNTVTYIILHP